MLGKGFLELKHAEITCLSIIGLKFYKIRKIAFFRYYTLLKEGYTIFRNAFISFLVKIIFLRFYYSFLVNRMLLVEEGKKGVRSQWKKRKLCRSFLTVKKELIESI